MLGPGLRAVLTCPEMESMAHLGFGRWGTSSNLGDEPSFFHVLLGRATFVHADSEYPGCGALRVRSLSVSLSLALPVSLSLSLFLFAFRPLSFSLPLWLSLPL